MWPTNADIYQNIIRNMHSLLSWLKFKDIRCLHSSPRYSMHPSENSDHIIIFAYKWKCVYWFEIFYILTLLYSILVFWQIGLKDVENKVIFWCEVDDLICKCDHLRGSLLEVKRKKNLWGAKNLNSKRVKVFDHSEMPVAFSSSEILKRMIFKESSALKNPQCSSFCDV